MLTTGNRNVVAGFLSLLFLYITGLSESASFDKPHKHQGLVSPYEPKAPKVDLDKKATALLDDGKIYKVSIGSVA